MALTASAARKLPANPKIKWVNHGYNMPLKREGYGSAVDMEIKALPTGIKEKLNPPASPINQGF